MTDYQLAHLTRDKNYYDGDLFHILSKRFPFKIYFPRFDRHDMVDCFIVADCFIRAGAEIRTRLEDGDIHIEIFTEAEDKDGFMERFGKLISEKYSFLGQDKRVLQSKHTEAGSEEGYQTAKRGTEGDCLLAQ